MVGGEFEGMGDFRITDEEYESKIGVKTVRMTKEDTIKYLSMVTDEEINAEIEYDKANYTVKVENTENYKASVKSGLAVRKWMEAERLDGVTVSFHDITDQVKEAVAESKIKDGIVVVYSHHTTCSVITQECAFDMSMIGLETLQQDLVNVFEEWIPTCRTEGMYLHPGQKALDYALEHGEDNFGCHNTDAHLRSSIIGRSVNIVIDDGIADLGEFGRVHFIDWDQTRGRERTVQIMIIGE